MKINKNVYFIKLLFGFSVDRNRVYARNADEYN